MQISTKVSRQQMTLAMFVEPMVTEDTRREYGTFKDSLRAPIHRWFTYPAGF